MLIALLTGYSFTDSDDGYTRNETAVGEDLYNAVLQFFQLFPELQKNEFYVTGESYAGKIQMCIALEREVFL
jgi:vitellogenic carboxypeptidase-like protein